MRVGGLQIERPFFQAALSGYSDYPMRAVARAHGAPLSMNEVVLDRLVLQPGKSRARALAVPDDDHPVGGQLMGSEPDAFARAAGDMVEAGYDFVDINFGCPVPKVLGRCRGGFLLGDPEVALSIVGGVVDAVAGRVPVTLKMRRGLDDGGDSAERFFRIFDGAYERGVAAITVHGRTVRQRYVGPSDWSFLAAVKRHAGAHMVFGSGDVLGPYAVRRMLAETGVDGVSLARGCIGNPFVFGQAADLLDGRTPRTPSLAQQRSAIEMHLAAARRVYPAARVSGAVRRHGIKYARLHPDPIAARDAWVAVRGPEALESVLAELYDEARFGPASPLPITADLPFGHEGCCGGDEPAQGSQSQGSQSQGSQSQGSQSQGSQSQESQS